MAFRHLIAALAFASTACAAAESGPANAIDKATETQLLPDIAILDGAQVRDMLDQCSRDTPAAGQNSWQPTSADIAALERGLAAALRERAPGEDWSRFPTDWTRQYVGIVRDGRRTIYGNAFPTSVVEGDPRWRTQPVVICDGGPAFFGVEYDPETGRYLHFSFNGMA